MDRVLCDLIFHLSIDVIYFLYIANCTLAHFTPYGHIYDVRDSLLFVLALFTPDGQMGQLLIDINESRRDFRARIAI